MIRISGTPKFVITPAAEQIIYTVCSVIFRSIAIDLIIAISPQ